LNPPTNKIEANFIDDKGKITGGVRANWLFGEQYFGTPLVSDSMIDKNKTA
jgi:hypothetical protein